MEAINLNPTAESPSENVTPGAGIGDLHIAHKSLYEMFGAKQGSGSTDRQLAMIWEWGKEHSPVKDDNDAIAWEIRKLSNRLGSASFNSKPWVNLATYVSTWKQQQGLEKRLKEMETNH